MNDKKGLKISELPELKKLTGDEMLVYQDKCTNGRISTDKLKEFVQDLTIIDAENIAVSTIEDIVANEEDLTLSTNNNDSEDKTKQLKFADKVYNPSNYSGLGRVYLRKNMVGDKNILTQSMINKPSVRYIIQYDYDLNEKTINIPEGSILIFEGGSINNGTINCVKDAIIQQFNGTANITGDYKRWDRNYIDNEDITSDEEGYLKFADKEYNPDNFSGLGHVYLRKNIVDNLNKHNVLAQDMINKANTIYHIKYDYDLMGNEITIPENCVLKFEGGSLSNGTVLGSLIIKNSKGFKCYISGSILNEYELYDTKDYIVNSSIISACKTGINLMEDISIQSCRLSCSLNGNNHKIIFVNQDEVDAIIIQNKQNIKISDVNFKKEKSISTVYKTHSLKIFDSNNVIVTNCYSEGGIDVRTSTTYWDSYNDNCYNIKIANCRFDIDWTPINNINQEQIYQNDIITIAGLLNVIIENNYFKFKNINRVFKITAFRTDVSDYIDFDNISRTVCITNNQIIGVNETDNGKQIIDCFFAGSHLELSHNYIDVSGHYCLIQDKSKAYDTLYKNLHTIIGNIIKYDNCLLNIINENTLSVLFKDNYCLHKRDLHLGNTPFSLGYCKNLIICNNVFESLSNVGSYFDLTHWGVSQAKAPNIDNFIIKDNIFDSCDFILQLIPDTHDVTIGNLVIKDNKRLTNTVIVRTTKEQFHVNIESVIIEDNHCDFENIYIAQFRNTTIKYFKLFTGYEIGKRVLQINDATVIKDFNCNLSLTNGVNKTAVPKKGSKYDQFTYFSNVPAGTEFYNTASHKMVYKDTDLNVWRDSSGIQDVDKFGNVTNRPSVKDIGFQYYDTTLNKPIWWTGSKWVDATGADV